MESFPGSFHAAKVEMDVVQNRYRKIEQDMKKFRKKIVEAFRDCTVSHIEVSHELMNDLSETEQKEFYKILKDELEQRQFVVRGKLENNIITFIIFSKYLSSIETEKVLKNYTDREYTWSNTHIPMIEGKVQRSDAEKMSLMLTSKIPQPPTYPTINATRPPTQCKRPTQQHNELSRIPKKKKIKRVKKKIASVDNHMDVPSAMLNDNHHADVSSAMLNGDNNVNYSRSKIVTTEMEFMVDRDKPLDSSIQSETEPLTHHHQPKVEDKVKPQPEPQIKTQPQTQCPPLENEIDMNFIMSKLAQARKRKK